jgi:hypothetical protein
VLRRLVSRSLDPDYAKKTLLLAEISVERTPRAGRIWCDAQAGPFAGRDLRSRSITFPDLHAWHIPNALVTDQYFVHDARNLYCDSSILVSGTPLQNASRACETFADEFARVDPQPVIEDHAAEQGLVLHNEGGGTWGHYLVQIFPKVLLFCARFPDGKVIVPTYYARGNSNFSQMFDAYGISRDRLIGVDIGKTYRFGEVILLDFPYSFTDVAVHPAALALLDCFAHESVPEAPPRGAYVERLPGSQRATANQAEVTAILAAAGIPATTIGNRSVVEQAALWQNHDLVVGTLGSDLSNIVFARPGSRVLVLSPDWFGDGFFYNLAIARGVGWYEIRCGRMGEPAQPQRNSSFGVDVELLRTVLAGLS